MLRFLHCFWDIINAQQMEIVVVFKNDPYLYSSQGLAFP